MAKPEGDIELQGQAGVGSAIIAVVGRDRAGSQQMRQEFAVGDVGDLCGDDRTGVVVKLIAAPRGMKLVQAVDLKVVLANEQRVQGCQREILRHARIAGREHAVDDR